MMFLPALYFCQHDYQSNHNQNFSTPVESTYTIIIIYTNEMTYNTHSDIWKTSSVGESTKCYNNGGSCVSSYKYIYMGKATHKEIGFINLQCLSSKMNYFFKWIALGL